MLLSRLGQASRLLWLLRYQTAVALWLIGLPLAAAFTRARISLGNLFAVGPFELALVTVLALAAGWTVMATVGLALSHAPARYGIVSPAPAPGLAPRTQQIGIYLLALPCVTLAFARAEGSASLSLLMILAAGFGAGWAGRRMPWIGAEGLRPNGSLGSSRLRAAGLRAMAALGPGYDEDWSTASAHAQALRRLAASVIAYLLIGLAFFPGWAPDGCLADLGPLGGLCFPALGYVLVVTLAFGWLLAGAAFLLDYWRLPTLLLLLAVALVPRLILGADHAFRVRPTSSQSASALLPADAMRSWLAGFPVGPEGDEPRLVVVTAAGGGIKAALWTDAVLGGLEGELGDEFTRSLGAVSAVSGGSWGALAYLETLEDRRHARPPEALDAIGDALAAGTLRATLWGLAYPDLLRGPLAPALWLSERAGLERLADATLLDRAWALERSWRRQLSRLRPGLKPQPGLAAWREDVRAGRRPALLMNAMSVESGKPLVLAPLDLGGTGLSGFFDRYPGYDLDLITAARLSATYPWITPVARPRAPSGYILPSEHLSDGGYFDNYGLVTLVDWLEAVLPTYQAGGGRRVLILTLSHRDCPPEAPADRDSGLCLPAEQRVASTDAGLGQLFAGPISAILNARGGSQLHRNRQTLDLLVSRWAGEIDIQHLPVVLEGDLPLSWQLTAAERASIESAWVARESTVVGRVRGFLED
jgi:hypothetical protein